MKRLLVTLILALTATTAYAACRTYSYTDANGRMVFCTECCAGSHCTISCF